MAGPHGRIHVVVKPLPEDHVPTGVQVGMLITEELAGMCPAECVTPAEGGEVSKKAYPDLYEARGCATGKASRKDRFVLPNVLTGEIHRHADNLPNEITPPNDAPPSRPPSQS